jgi:type I restriction enzyme M protein
MIMLQSISQIVLVPAGKIECFVTGRLRKDTPEEQVRQEFAQQLVEEYKYPRTTLEIEYGIYIGSSYKRVDIVIFEPNKLRTQENISIIVETKREKVKPTDPDNGVEQLKSYMSACPNALWGIWRGSETKVFRKTVEGGRIRFIEEPVLPPFGQGEPVRVKFKDLMPAQGLKKPFRRIHNYIYANEGLQKDAAFHELLKLIFTKVLDEEQTYGEMNFDIDADERLSATGQQRLRKRLEQVFNQVKTRYSYIFESDEQIKLSDRVLSYIVSELRLYSLLKTRTDIKGEAYQELVRDNLRGDRGEFFTPDNVCEMAARMVYSMFPREQWSQLSVLDPSCGTGGFLRAALNVLREEQYRRQRERGENEALIDKSVREIVRDICQHSLFGIDINPMLVRAAQMNLVMHGDGSTNIYRENSLLPFEVWGEDIRDNLPIGQVDIILTNPPFGSGEGLTIDDRFILSKYTLPSATNQSKIAPEQLFIERCYQLLRPGGYVAMVLPDSILSNPGLLSLRKWILKHYKVIASVDLPLETFVAFSGTGTQTSVLLLQKKTQKEHEMEELTGKMLGYNTFMAIPKTMGYDRRGNDLWRRTPEGEEIEEVSVEDLGNGKQRVNKTKIRNDEVAQVFEAFIQWKSHQ